MKGDFIVPGTNGMSRFWRFNASGADEIGGNTLSVSNTTYKKTARGYQTYCATANGSSSSLTSGATVSGVRTVFFSIYPTSNNRTFLTATGITITINSSSQIATSGLTGVSVTVNGQATSSIALNAWNFVAITHDSANYASVNIFASSFIGDAQEVGTFDRVISETEIRNWYLESLRALGGSTLAGLMDGLVSYGDFRGDANEIIGGNDGTVTGAVLTSDRFGTASSAYSFNGTTDFITSATPSAVAGDFTIIANVKWNSLIGTQIPLGIGEATTGKARAIIKNITTNFIGFSSFGSTVMSTTPVTASTDYNIIVTGNSGVVKVYLDGAEVASGSPTLTTFASTTVKVGANTANNNKYNGNVDEWAVMDRGVSGSEALAISQLSKKGKLIPFA